MASGKDGIRARYKRGHLQRSERLGLQNPGPPCTVVRYYVDSGGRMWMEQTKSGGWGTICTAIE